MRPRALEVRRILGLPRQVDDGADPLAAAAQHAVARAVAVLARVELDEVGVRLVLLADEDGDAQHRLGRVEQLVGAARALPGEDEADEVGARLDRRVDVLLPGEAADLDERPRDQLRELRAGVGRAHQRRADEHRVRAGQLGGGALGARRDRGLRDDDPVARRLREQPQLRVRGRARRSRGRAR